MDDTLHEVSARRENGAPWPLAKNVPLYYAVRIVSDEGRNVARSIVVVASVEQLQERVHNAAPDEAEIETKCLGSGEPIYGSRGPKRRAFHTVAQLASYEAGLMGHGHYPLEHGPLDNFNYLGAMDAEEFWGGGL